MGVGVEDGFLPSFGVCASYQLPQEAIANNIVWLAEEVTGWLISLPSAQVRYGWTRPGNSKPSGKDQ